MLALPPLLLVNAVTTDAAHEMAVWRTLYRLCAGVCRTHIFTTHTSVKGQSNEQIKFCGTHAASGEFAHLTWGCRGRGGLLTWWRRSVCMEDIPIGRTDNRGRDVLHGGSRGGSGGGVAARCGPRPVWRREVREKGGKQAEIGARAPKSRSKLSITLFEVNRKHIHVFSICQ